MYILFYFNELLRFSYAYATFCLIFLNEILVVISAEFVWLTIGIVVVVLLQLLLMMVLATALLTLFGISIKCSTRYNECIFKSKTLTNESKLFP